MSRKRRTSPSAQAFLTPAEPDADSRALAYDGFHSGMFASIFLCAVMLAVESSRFGHWLSLSIYNGMYSRLERNAGDCVVLDIAELSDSPRTNTDLLAQLVEAAARCRPSAIGLDIDLSPASDPQEAARDLPADRTLLSRLLDIRDSLTNPVPVFVGVYRSAPQPKKHWLLEDRYSPLASHIWIADDARGVIPAWIVQERYPDDVLWGLGLSLALEHAKHRSRSKRLDGHGVWPRWFAIPEISPTNSSDERWQGFLLDCSAIEDLVRARIPATRPETVSDVARRLEGKIILIGRADPERARENSFLVPGMSKPYPGTYLHACAAMTALDGFLFMPTEVGRVVLDLGFALVVFGGLLLIRLGGIRRGQGKPRVRRLHVTLTLVAITLAVFFGYVLVPRTRLLWDGFAYVAVALFLHLFLEGWFHTARRWVLGFAFQPAKKARP